MVNDMNINELKNMIDNKTARDEKAEKERLARLDERRQKALGRIHAMANELKDAFELKDYMDANKIKYRDAFADGKPIMVNYENSARVVGFVSEGRVMRDEHGKTMYDAYENCVCEFDGIGFVGELYYKSSTYSVVIKRTGEIVGFSHYGSGTLSYDDSKIKQARVIDLEFLADNLEGFFNRLERYVKTLCE